MNPTLLLLVGLASTQVAGEVNARIKPLWISQIEAVPHSGDYVAVAGVLADDAGFTWHKNPELLYIHSQGLNSNPSLTFERMKLPTKSSRGGGDLDEKDSDCITMSLRLMKLGEFQKGWAVVVERDFRHSDCHPSLIHVITLPAGKIGMCKTFASLITETRVLPPSAGHGLRVLAAPTFKVWWPDVYEWANGRFHLANRQNRSLYNDESAQWKPDDRYFPGWMSAAAVAGIRGRFRTALTYWKRAERTCQRTLRFGVNNDRGYRDSGFFGEEKICLSEIRQRIRWLKSRSYDHDLLYRPYDFDLQVPPYRLGKAHGSQYE